jgi:hypothetical protein
MEKKKDWKEIYGILFPFFLAQIVFFPSFSLSEVTSEFSVLK